MANGHGGARPNTGPKNGSKHKFDKELAKRLKDDGEVTPLDVMLAMMKDNGLEPMVRMRAAAAAAVYVHRKKPQALEISGKFEFLSPEERAMRRNLLIEEIRTRQALGAGTERN